MKNLFRLLLIFLPLYTMASIDVGNWRVSSYDIKTKTAVLGKYLGSSTSVTVPNGITINVFDSSDNKKKDIYFNTKLGSSLFKDNNTIVSVSLGNHSIIPSWCFSGCSSLKNVSGAYGVTMVDGRAFNGCTSLESFEGFATVTNIGSYAFSGCASLKSVVAHNLKELGSNVFDGCSGLESVSLKGDALIFSSVFRSCSSLRRLELLGNMGFSSKSYYNDPFEGCKSIEEVVFGEGVGFVPESLFESKGLLTNVTVTSSLTNIYDKAFSGCKSLKSLKGAGSVTGIGWSAFSGCSLLESFEGFSAVTNIGSSAFSGCASLKSVVAHNLKELGSSVFKGCSGLESVSLKGDALIKQCAFGACSSLRRIEILGNVGFSSTSYGDDSYMPFDDSNSIEEVVLGEGVSFIPASLFWNKGFLTNVTVTSSLTDIYGSAFSGCSSLESFEGFAAVTNIGSSAFSGCSSLTGKVDLVNLKTVESSIFKNCKKLRQVKFGKDLELVRADAFSGSTNLIAFTFEGLPPEADNNAFRNVKKGALGIYPTSTLEFDDAEDKLRSVQTLSETPEKKEWCDVIADDGTWKKLLMAANKPILTNDVYDVKEGSLQLNWKNEKALIPSAKEYGITYEIRRGFTDNYETADILTNGYDQLQYVDKQFDFTGGVSRIWYWVKPEHECTNLFERSDSCRTKNRYARGFGTVDLNAINDAWCFTDLAYKKGGFPSVDPLQDPPAEVIKSTTAGTASLLTPGDIVVFYYAAHGEEGATWGPYLKFVGSRYYASDLKVDSEMVSERQARFVGIIMSCHSQAMIKDGNIVKESEALEQFCNASCGEGSNNLIAWITSSRKDQFSYASETTINNYTRFGNSFLKYGWEDGYADVDLYIEGKQEKVDGHNDNRITLLEMAHYASAMAVGGFANSFNWKILSSVDGNSSVYIQNPELLNRICMGKSDSVHDVDTIEPPTTVILKKSFWGNNCLLWTSVANAISYRVYRYLENPDKPQAVHLQVIGLSVEDNLGRGFLNRNAYKYFIQAESPWGISKRSVVAVEDVSNALNVTVDEFKNSLAAYGLNTNGLDDDELDKIASADLDGDGFNTMDEYISGVSPLDPNSQFIANITMENGKPKVTPNPDLGDKRKYTIYGKKDLSSQSVDWADMLTVPELEKSEYHFFKVDVSLP